MKFSEYLASQITPQMTLLEKFNAMCKFLEESNVEIETNRVYSYRIGVTDTNENRHILNLYSLVPVKLNNLLTAPFWINPPANMLFSEMTGSSGLIKKEDITGIEFTFAQNGYLRIFRTNTSYDIPVQGARVKNEEANISLELIEYGV